MSGVKRVCGRKGCPVLAHVFAPPKMQRESPAQGATIDATFFGAQRDGRNSDPEDTEPPVPTNFPSSFFFEPVFSLTKLCTLAGPRR